MQVLKRGGSPLAGGPVMPFPESPNLLTRNRAYEQGPADLKH
jgi:hypothetical protein